MRTRLITLDVPEPLLAALEQAAHHRAVSLAALMREALARDLPGDGLRDAGGPPARMVAAQEPDDDEVIDRFDSLPAQQSSPPPP